MASADLTHMCILNLVYSIQTESASGGAGLELGQVRVLDVRDLIMANDAGHKSTVTKGVAMFRSCEF